MIQTTTPRITDIKAANVSDAYSELQFVKNTGSQQYIDTGLMCNKDFEVEMQFSISGAVSAENPIASIWTSASNYWNMFVSSGSTTVVDVYTDGHHTISVADLRVPTLVRLKRTGTTFTFTLGNETITWEYETISNNTATLKLFARGDTQSQAQGITIYYATIHTGSETIRLIPAKRKSNNAVGMYDGSRFKFLSSAGTGALTGGAIVSPVDITEGIENGSLDLYECLCQNPFEFGKLTSDKLEFRLYRDIDLSGKEITVTQTIDGASVPIFSGIVDECKRDNLNTYRNVVAYDKAESLRDLSVSSWWETFWTNKTSTTLLQLLTSLCSEFSLTLSKTTTVNDNLTVFKSMELEDGALTFGDILTYICELMCVFPHINRSGALELIAPWNISASGYVPVTDKYEPGNTEFEEYTTDAITAVYCIEDGVTRGSAGTGTNAVSIVNNPLLYDVTDGNISSAMANILTALNGYSFTPATIQMIISGPDLPLGSMVSHSRGRTLVVENHLYSSQLFEQEIGVSVERTHGVDASYRPDVRRISGRIMNAESRLEVDEDKISMVVEGTGTSKKIKAAAIITAINGDESAVSIQADKIRLNGYTDINGYFSVAEDGKVTLRDCLLDINSGSYDGQQIVLNGTVTGGGYYDGQTFSNAQKIGSNVIKNITTGIGANFQFDGMQVAKEQNPLVIVNGTTYQGNTAGQVFVLSTADSQIGAGQAVLQPHLLNITNGGKTVEITPEYETVNGTKRIYKAVDYSMSAGQTAYIQVPVINATGTMYVTLYNQAGYSCGGSVIFVVSYRNSSAAKANIAVLQNYIDPIEGISEPPTYYFNASQATADYLPILARCSGAIRYKVCFEMYVVE